MINKLIKSYIDVDKDIKKLEIILCLCLLFLIYKGTTYLYNDKIESLWELIQPGITLISALIITSVSKRLILNNNICIESERINDVIMTTHYLIALTKDIIQKTNYLKEGLISQKITASTICEIIKSIEERYQNYYDKKIYRHLPTEFVDIIINQSGNIFGMRGLSQHLKNATKEKPNMLLSEIKMTSPPPHENLEKLINDLEKIHDILFEVRESVDNKSSTP